MHRTNLLVWARSPYCADSRTLADCVLAFEVCGPVRSLVALARAIDALGQAAVDGAIHDGQIRPLGGNMPGWRPVAGHGVTIVYATGRRRTVRWSGGW